jgi:hypothetical protein
MPVSLSKLILPPARAAQAFLTQHSLSYLAKRRNIGRAYIQEGKSDHVPQTDGDMDGEYNAAGILRARLSRPQAPALPMARIRAQIARVDALFESSSRVGQPAIGGEYGFQERWRKWW